MQKKIKFVLNNEESDSRMREKNYSRSSAVKPLHWKILSYILLAAWVLGAVLFMARVKGGFLTNYLSDLAFPAWFYIYLRGLAREDGRLPGVPLFADWFGRSPERAFISVFLIGAITELKTLYLPTGIITGRFDPMDIVAYAAGMGVCWAADRIA